MNYKKTVDGTKMSVRLIGEVDSLYVANIKDKLLEEVMGVTDLTIDLKELEYISSAGLHLLLEMQKIMKTQGKMMIININDDIMDILKVTGLEIPN